MSKWPPCDPSLPGDTPGKRASCPLPALLSLISLPSLPALSALSISPLTYCGEVGGRVSQARINCADARTAS